MLEYIVHAFDSRLALSYSISVFKLDLRIAFAILHINFIYCLPLEQFKPEMLEVVFKYAKFQYECGNYSATADYMYLFRCLVPPTDKVTLMI